MGYVLCAIRSNNKQEYREILLGKAFQTDFPCDKIACLQQGNRRSNARRTGRFFEDRFHEQVIWRSLMVYRFASPTIYGLWVLLCWNVVARATSAQEPESSSAIRAIDLLPRSTDAMIRIVDFPAIVSAWKKTTLHQLTLDPALGPFFDAQRINLKSQNKAAGLQIDLQLNDLQDMASGEVILAWINRPADPKRRYSMCLIVESGGRREKADEVVTQIDQTLIAREAKRVDSQHRGQTIRVYTMPRSPGQLKVVRVALMIDNDRVIIGNGISVVQMLLDAVAGEPADSGLVDSAAFKNVFQKIGRPQASEIQWFAHPLSLVEIIRQFTNTNMGTTNDFINILRKQGFDMVQGAGGRIQVAQRGLDLRHQGFVWAPTPDGQTDRFQLAAKMLQFPNEPLVSTPRWVLGDAASCMYLNWNMTEAFWGSESVVNEAFDRTGIPGSRKNSSKDRKNYFRSLLDKIKNAPNGVQLDIPKELIAHLDDRLILVTNNALPVGSKSDHMLIAVQLKNVAAVKQSVENIMSKESDVSLITELKDHKAWEFVSGNSANLSDNEALFQDFDEPEEDEDSEENEDPFFLEGWGITVVADPSLGDPLQKSQSATEQGYLMFSNDVSFLVDTVRRVKSLQDEGLGGQPEIQRIHDRMTTLGGGVFSAARVNQTRLSWRNKYELLRKGELRSSDSVLPSLLRRAFKSSLAKQGEGAPLRDAQLPEFSVIEKYLRPSGSFLRTEEDGWIFESFLFGDEEVDNGKTLASEKGLLEIPKVGNESHPDDGA